MLDEQDRKALIFLRKSLIDNCAVCKGSGVPCECRDKYEFEVRKILAHIPHRYRFADLTTIESKESLTAKNAVQQYLEKIDEHKKNGTGLFLWSEEKGTAKTYMGSCVLINALRHGYTCYFTSLDECVALITSGWFDEDKRAEFEQKILESDFLLVDDVGGKEIITKGNGELIKTTLVTLFKSRYDNLLPTIMTSNLSLKDVGERVSERLQSVMYESVQIECKGPDYRKLLGADL